jgi:hypothetical protein
MVSGRKTKQSKAPCKTRAKVQEAAPFLSVQWVMQVHKQKILKGEWQEWSLY